ncbi:MAG: hypothetical protein RIR74_1318, partial [Pseudomonadota bacterium]
KGMPLEAVAKATMVNFERLASVA